MTEVQDSWRDVMSKTEALGQKLRSHLEREDAEAKEAAAQAAETAPEDPEPQGIHGDDAPDSSGSGSEPTGDGASKAGSTRAAVEDLGHRLQDAFESFGQAAKDPAVRHDVKDIGVALKDALMSTLTKVSGEVGGAVKKVGGQGEAEPDAVPADTPPSPDSGTAPTAGSNGTDERAAGGGSDPEAGEGPGRGEPAP